MPRQQRHEVPGGYYHLTVRGNGGGSIFVDDDDRAFLLAFLGRLVLRERWRCFAYCLMSNHYHVVVQIREASLARGMRWLNGLYAQTFNGRHGRTGHLFGGRYRASVIESEEHLAEACRYVVCNPLRAGLCDHPREWPWSSYRATAREASVPPFLDSASVLKLLGGIEGYREYVEELVEQPALT